MAVIYINESRIDTDAPVDDIVNGLMHTGWLIVNEDKDYLSNGDISIKVDNGYVRIDLNRIAWNGKSHDYTVTVDGVNVRNPSTYPKNKYVAEIIPTTYTCWNTTTGLCFLTREEYRVFIVEVLRECNVPTLAPEFSYKSWKIRLHDIPPANIGLTYNGGILSDDCLSLATCNDGTIDTACVKMCDKVNVGFVFEGKIASKMLVTKYKRAELSENGNLIIHNKNGDQIAFYLDGESVKDIVLYGGKT